MVADTATGAASEGEISESRAGVEVLGVRVPAVGVEVMGVGPEAGVYVGDAGGEEEDGISGEARRAEGEGAEGAAADEPGGGMEAQGFGDDLAGVGERGGVGVFGVSLVYFGFKSLAHGGMLGENVPGPGEGVGDGFVAGEEEGEGFVALLGGSEAAGLEAGKQVAGVGAGGVGGVEGVGGGGEGLMGVVGISLSVRAGGEGAVEGVEGFGDGFGDGVGGGGVAAGEEGGTDDLKREAHHFAVEVESLACLPVGIGFAGMTGHVVGVGSDLRGVEGGLEETPAGAVAGAVGGEKAVAEQGAGAEQAGAFGEGFGGA